MKSNIPIPDLPLSEEVWLIVSVMSVRERYTQKGKPFRDATGRNASGTIELKIWSDALQGREQIKPGLWKVAGKLEQFQSQQQFVVTQYKPATLEDYRQYQHCDPPTPRAFTIDIETIALPEFRVRAGSKLERDYRLIKMPSDQQQRYLEDIAAEEEREYQLGSFKAVFGRVLSIAVHVGAVAGFEIPVSQAEYAFGIDEAGTEQEERQALNAFLSLMSDFDYDCDVIVGHNIIGFDLPFIYQRCLINNIPARPPVNLTEYNVRGVFDTMRAWWFGGRNRVGLDDLAWALGIESSKTAEVEGSKVFELYQAGRLAEIREYNLNDVRVTRKVYERMVACFGG